MFGPRKIWQPWSNQVEVESGFQVEPEIEELETAVLEQESIL
jgi:hypothetical protein